MIQRVKKNNSSVSRNILCKMYVSFIVLFEHFPIRKPVVSIITNISILVNSLFHLVRAIIWVESLSSLL